MDPPLFDFKDTTQDDEVGSTILKQAKKSPFLIAGILGLFTVCGIGAYKWKTKKIPGSLFILQLRVAAQSAAVGCITIGMVYQMYQDFVIKKDKTQK